jgi:hypothetical protein
MFLVFSSVNQLFRSARGVTDNNCGRSHANKHASQWNGDSQLTATTTKGTAQAHEMCTGVAAYPVMHVFLPHNIHIYLAKMLISMKTGMADIAGDVGSHMRQKPYCPLAHTIHS